MKRAIIGIILSLTMLVGYIHITVNAEYSGTCGENLTWILDDSGTLTISGEGEMDCTWTETGYGWSYNKNIKTVIIKDGVTTIDYRAFASCSNLTSITIPPSIIHIGNSPFAGCCLENVYISDIKKWCEIDFQSYDSNPVYYAKKLTLNNENVTNLVIPDTVTSIGDEAFHNCETLESVKIPNSVVSIGAFAFDGCSNLTNVHMPESITDIGNFAFSNTKLSNISIPNGKTIIPMGMFYGCDSLTSVSIPKNITTIGYQAFCKCDNLTDIYYEGTYEEWNSINIVEEGNDTVKNAIIHCGDITYTPPTPTVTPIPTPTIPPIEVIVAPPTANVESGTVPYGTKVTFTPSGAHIAYSVNGGDFKYEYSSDVTLTIKEDTTVTVKSWVDYLSPNTSYLIGEATYTYTVDKATIPIYPYQITGLRFTDTSGNEIILPEAGKSFIVETDIVKTEERNEKDYLFVAVYDENGALMSLDYVKAKFTVDGECSFGFNIPAQAKKVGSVKAFVWNTFNSMEPLAQSQILAPVVFE